MAWLDPNPEEGVAPMRSGWAYPEAEEVERGLPLADDGPADGPAVDCWHGLAWVESLPRAIRGSLRMLLSPSVRWMLDRTWRRHSD